MSQSLSQYLDSISAAQGPLFFQNQVPAMLRQNLSTSYALRPYQQEALGRFAWYWQEQYNKPEHRPEQLLFHMATGSGKTLLMAGLMLYLYEQGYRNFLFFVDSTNILAKTRDNFLNPASSKYLFADRIILNSQQLVIREAENFQACSEGVLNLIFSTVQGLHSRLNSPAEGGIGYDDFADEKLVLLSDEAHHLNAETKKGKKPGTAADVREISWEATVKRIFEAHPQNVLLEFTATANLAAPEIGEKYSQKLIFDYSLRQFRSQGYSKEVRVLQGSMPLFQRTLQAVLLSQYRMKLFEQWGRSIKPVLLFKSNTIKESQLHMEQFLEGMKSLQPEALLQLQQAATEPAIKQAFAYFQKRGITPQNLIGELREDFSEEKLLCINSREESEKKQLALNSLEDEGNPYRAIFAVDKLNEGWDVLNLFDIVRLYDSPDAKAGKLLKTTMAEAQLIGRGARYCPFRINPEQPLQQRKWDDEPEHPLRICEELYYHSPHNPAYIRELYSALEENGLRDKVDRGKQQKVPLQIAKSAPQNVTGGRKPNLSNGLCDFPREAGASGYPLKVLGEHLIRKALRTLPFYQFSNLKRYLPALLSVSEFIGSEQYLGRFHVPSPKPLHSLSPEEKLQTVLELLEEISDFLSTGRNVHQGL